MDKRNLLNFTSTWMIYGQMFDGLHAHTLWTTVVSNLRTSLTMIWLPQAAGQQ